MRGEASARRWRTGSRNAAPTSLSSTSTKPRSRARAQRAFVSASPHATTQRTSRSENDVVNVFDRVVGDFGRLDAAIANAGILRDGLLIKAKDGEITGKMSLAQWQAVIDVNLTGVFLCGREAAERMVRAGNGGCIINISSISREGNFGQSNYSAAKAGVAALTVVWAKELARHGIRVNAIAPGFVKTEMVASMKPEMLEKMAAGHSVAASRASRTR